MNNVIKRVLLTVIGIPLFLTVIFLDFANHLPLAVVASLFVLFGSYESSALLSLARNPRKEIDYRLPLPPWLTVIFPASAYIELVIDTEIQIVTLVLIALITAVMVIEIIRGAEDEYFHSADRMGRQLTAMLYPAFPVIYLIRMTHWEESDWLIGLFFLLIFANDVFAYLFGMLFGKGSRNIVKVSPKKSLVGFMGGTFMTVVIGFCYLWIIPISFSFIGPVTFTLLFILISFTANIGDLFESVLKRFAQVKDSGTIIPGRGGVLDTIDSIVFSLPFFFYFLNYLL